MESIEECLPRPAKHFIPEWFKDIPSEILMSVKNCPSFSDYFSQGYILPMWADSILEYTDKGWKWETAVGNFKWETHFNDQLIDHKKPSFLELKVSLYLRLYLLGELLHPQDGLFYSYRFSIILIKSGLFSLES